MKRVVVPGGTGFLGRALSRRLLDRGDAVTVLTRGHEVTDGRLRHVTWDARTLGAWDEVLEGADAVVNLTGKRVDCRPTGRNVEGLIRSRVEPVVLLGQALARAATPPPVWVQSSTLAIFGEGGDGIITERTIPSGQGPRQMVQVAMAWEHAFGSVADEVDRSVLLRIGVTIGGADDPATKRLASLARWGLGGPVGSGRQWMSWVALDDVLEVMLRTIDDPGMEGLYHVTAATPATNAELMATVRAAVGRRGGLPSPGWLTRLGAPLLGSDAALALTGRRCVPERLLAEGFRFAGEDLAAAVDDAVRQAHHA